MKIAAFDSGIGGLIALAPLIKKKSGLEITYLGDLANLPYGTKSPQRIKELTRANITGLFGFDKKHFDLFILACNTASAHALEIAEQLGHKENSQVLGVIKPGCEWTLQHLKDQPHSRRIVILGTTATVKSEIYPKTLREYGFMGDIVQVAAPLFVPLVESEFENTPAAEFAIRHYLEKIIQPNDIVILGCTHYPLLKNTLRRLFPQVIHWTEAGEALLNVSPFVKDQPIQSQKNKLTILLTDTTVETATLQRLFEKLEISNFIEWDLKHIPPFA